VTIADQGGELCAIVTFSCAQRPANQLQQQLALRQINTSSVPFSANPVSSEKFPHPVLLRASPHYYNTVEEIEHFVAELKKLL
jgi:selenocysteine lyase/cysteine desulfurase